MSRIPALHVAVPALLLLASGCAAADDGGSRNLAQTDGGTGGDPGTLPPGGGGAYGTGGSQPFGNGGAPVGPVGSGGFQSPGSGGFPPVSAGGIPGGGGFPDPGGTGGTPGPGGAPPTGGTPGTGGPGTPFPPATDFAAKGTFPTMTGPGGATCTIFRPSTLGDGGLKHPAIVWGNGTFNSPSNYTELFNHLASHGFIIAAANTSDAGSGKEMLACLDYVTQQNGTAGPFQDKVDLAHVGVFGYSQGGAGTLAAGVDPRFVATAPVSPFIVLPLGGYDATAINKQTHPMFLISGSADIVAEPNSNQNPIFTTSKVPIVWGTFAGADHFQVMGNGGAYRGPLTAWFRFQLMNDSAAGDYFRKTPCKLCSTQGWTVKFNDLWTQ